MPERILETLRVRICLTPPGESFVLQEGVIAQEFNVSRTPVRQVLQTLARERLIQVRPSVAAKVCRLAPSGKATSFQVYRDLLAIAARLANTRPVPQEVSLELEKIHDVARSQTTVSAELYVSLIIRFQAAISELVEDEILHDALLATSWRLIRWRVHGLEADRETQRARFMTNIELALEASRSGSAARLLRTVAEFSDRFALEAARHF